MERFHKCQVNNIQNLWNFVTSFFHIFWSKGEVCILCCEGWRKLYEVPGVEAKIWAIYYFLGMTDLPCKWNRSTSMALTFCFFGDFFWWLLTANSERTSSDTSTGQGQHGASSSNPSLEHKPLGSLNFTMAELKRMTANFSAASKIGQGGCATVYRGKLPDGRIIAIKRTKKVILLEDRCIQYTSPQTISCNIMLGNVAKNKWIQVSMIHSEDYYRNWWNFSSHFVHFSAGNKGSFVATNFKLLCASYGG